MPARGGLPQSVGHHVLHHSRPSGYILPNGRRGWSVAFVGTEAVGVEAEIRDRKPARKRLQLMKCAPVVYLRIMSQLEVRRTRTGELHDG